MLIQSKQVIDIQDASKAGAEKRVEPPKEGAVVDIAGSLGRRVLKGGVETSLLQGFQRHQHDLDQDGRGGQIGNGMVDGIARTQPEGSGADDIQQKSQKQKRVEYRGWSDRPDMFVI